MPVRPAILPVNHMRKVGALGLTTGQLFVSQSDVDSDYDPNFTAMRSAVGFPQREQCLQVAYRLSKSVRSPGTAICREITALSLRRRAVVAFQPSSTRARLQAVNHCGLISTRTLDRSGANPHSLL